MKRPLAFMCIAICLVLISPVRAPALTFNLGYVFSGDTPTGASPWLQVNITNITGGVQIDLVNQLKSSPEFISNAYLNVNPALDLLAFTVQIPLDPQIESIALGTDGFKADGDGFFDILVNFPASNAENRFQMGETASFNLLYPGLTESDFVFLSALGGGAGSYYAAAHVQGIPGEGEGSSWIGSTGPETPQEPIPEPATIMLIGSGLLAGWWRSKRK